MFSCGSVVGGVWCSAVARFMVVEALFDCWWWLSGVVVEVLIGFGGVAEVLVELCDVGYDVQCRCWAVKCWLRRVCLWSSVSRGVG
ncbi:hypothetical protein Droror1_Dr00017371 [Drosera rotundifolia]